MYDEAKPGARQNEIMAPLEDTAMAYSILLIDDDVELGELISEYLRAAGHAVAMAHNGEAGLAAALTGQYDIVLLDVMLPRMDGFSVLTRLRTASSVPVLMLTAKGDPASRITGLQTGADDYLPKPFEPLELLLRINSVLRRSQPANAAPQSVVEVGGVVLDAGARRVTRGEQLVDLTSIEYDILEMLIRAAGRVVSRDELMQKLNQRAATPFDRSIDVHISHLRKKLDDSGELIITVRGVGYQFALGERS
jgi:two-component system response regulator CpxR